jgi:putative methyltransferase (TIGR04325 family)
MKDIIWKMLPYSFRRWWTSRTRKSQYGWYGEYDSWSAAQSDSEGYQKKEIEDKIFQAALEVKNGNAYCERDGILFQHPVYFENTRKAIEYIGLRSEKFKIADFGGGAGSSYFLYCKLLNSIRINSWNIIEQRHIAERGNRELADERLQFFSEINEACVGDADVLLLSSVLHYMEQPQSLLIQLLRYSYRRIIIETTPVTTGLPFITVQRVPPHIYEASYPCHIFNCDTFLSWFPGYKLLAEYISNAVEPRMVEGRMVEWKGFVFERENEVNT